MCGIAGYIGPRKAIDVVFDQLKRLEYRGYDSAGIAFINGGEAITFFEMVAIMALALAQAVRPWRDPGKRATDACSFDGCPSETSIDSPSPRFSPSRPAV